MTFLNPLMLFGLAAAAIPVLIHLLNLRKLRTVQFSSLQFLKELQRSSIRRLRIRQFLLLFLRTLLIAALVLAFSRPAMRGSMAGLVGGEAGSCVVLVLDDSPSMSVRNDRGVLFAQAQEAALDILDVAGDNAELYLILLSNCAERGAAPAGLEAARALVRSSTVTPVSVPIDSAIARAIEILAATPQANRELFIITDGQATQFPSHPAQEDTLPPALSGAYAGYLLTFPHERLDNAGVGPAEVVTRILTVGAPARIQVTVRNPGDLPLDDVSISAYLDGARMAQQSVRTGPRSNAAAELIVTPRRRGTLAGYVELEEDILDADNRYHFALDIPERIRVLLAGSAEATRLVHLALTLGGDSTLAGVFSVEQASPERLDALDLRAIDLVALCAVPSPAPVVVERLSRYVTEGGALAIFPGPGIDIAAYNSRVFPALGMPEGAMTDLGERSEDVVRFGRIDYAHPLFEGLFDAPLDVREGRKEIESPGVLRAFAPRSTGAGRTIISLSNGQAFLVEYRLGAGRIMAFAVDPGLAWSDFAVKGIFVPLMHRTMLYAAPANRRASGITAGAPVDVTVRQGRLKPDDRFLLRTPGGREERLVPKSLPGGGLRFTGRRTRETGNHLLVRQSGPDSTTEERLVTVPVNLAPLESDLRTITEEETGRFWARARIDPARALTVRSSSDVRASLREARVGVELWRHFLAMALLCALLEMAVGRVPKPEGQSA